MSQGPETTFINSVHRHLPPTLYHMKNHNVYNGGIADCWYSGKRDLWIEYKFIVVPAHDKTTIDLVGGKKPEISALQQEWLKERHKEGRQVGVIVGSKDGGVWFPNVQWQAPITTADFRHYLQDRKTLAQLIVRLSS